MKNNEQHILPFHELNELNREIMLTLNQKLYNEGYLTHEIYRIAKERFLTMNLENT